MIRHFPRAALAVLVTSLIAWAALNREALDPAVLDRWLADLGIWAPIAFVALYVAGTVAFLPGSLLALAGGALFGPVWGTLLNLLSATLGASFAFLVARYIAGDLVAAKTKGQLKRLMDGVEFEGWRFVALVRLVPLVPFNLTNYALGLTRIGFIPYVATSFLCMIPGAIAYTWLGHAGRSALAGNEAAIRYGLLALGLLAAIALLPQLIKRLRQTAPAADTAFEWAGPEQLNARLMDGKPVIVDVRGTDEFSGPLGHLAGAINIPVADLPARLSEIKALVNEPVFVVCRTDRRSAVAASILKEAAFGDVHVLRGGMEQWNREGLPVERC
jgi:uncharacterized membrane protein YdjX (TVP38/TMEM64 family)/rhodanese-related sulfurtransferase